MDKLPIELLLNVGSNVGSTSDLTALARVSRHFYVLFEPALYARALRSRVLFSRLILCLCRKDGGSGGDEALVRAKKLIAAGQKAETVWPEAEAEVEMSNNEALGVSGRRIPGRYIETALSVAVLEGNDQLVELFLSAGARTEFGALPIHPDHQKHTGHSHRFQLYECAPLTCAAYQGSASITRLLLRAGAPELGGSAGRRQMTSAIQVALDRDDSSVVAVLLEAIMTLGFGREELTTNETDEPGLGRPALLAYAAAGGCLAIAEQLIYLGAGINVAGHGELQPLLLASKFGHLQMVKLLLDHGADPNGRAHDHETPRRWPVQAAADAGHGAVVEILLSSGAVVDATGTGIRFQRTALSLSAERGDVSTVELLLRHGADIHSQSGTDEFDVPMWYAARKGRLDVVETLLRHGADVKTKTGCRLLVGAAAHLDVTELLIEHGADVNSSFANMTPLTRAASFGHSTVVEALLRHGADVNARSKWSDTKPLYGASKEGHLEAVKLLLKHGADVNANTSGGGLRTALSGAASRGHAAVVQTLLEHGANVNANRTALSASADAVFFSSMDVALTPGADIEGYIGGRCRTALHLAAEGGHVAAAEALVNHGADVEALDGNNNRPLWTALDFGQFTVANMLLRHGADVEATRLRGQYEETVLHMAVATAKARPSEYESGPWSVGNLTELQQEQQRQQEHFSARRAFVEAIIIQPGAEVEDSGNYERDMETEDQVIGQAVYIAATMGCADIVEVLMSHRESLGNTQQLTTDKILLKHVVSTENAHKSHRGARYADVIRVLCRRGGHAFFNALNPFGRMAATEAARSASEAIMGIFTERPTPALEYPALFAALRERGADIDARDDQGRRPAIVEAFRIHSQTYMTSSHAKESRFALEALEALLENGAELEVGPMIYGMRPHGCMREKRFRLSLVKALEERRGASWDPEDAAALHVEEGDEEDYDDGFFDDDDGPNYDEYHFGFNHYCV